MDSPNPPTRRTVIKTLGLGVVTKATAAPVAAASQPAPASVLPTPPEGAAISEDATEKAVSSSVNQALTAGERSLATEPAAICYTIPQEGAKHMLHPFVSICVWQFEQIAPTTSELDEMLEASSGRAVERASESDRFTIHRDQGDSWVEFGFSQLDAEDASEFSEYGIQSDANELIYYDEIWHFRSVGSYLMGISAATYTGVGRPATRICADLAAEVESELPENVR